MVNYIQKPREKEMLKNGLCDSYHWDCNWVRSWNGGRQIMDTYITLSILLISSICFIVWLLKNYFKREKKNFHSYDLPLDNKNKWWYN